MAAPIQANSAGDAFAVTPSDTTIVNAVALYVGTGGDVTIGTRNGKTVTFANVPDGSILPVFAVKVMAATTATGIVGLTY